MNLEKIGLRIKEQRKSLHYTQESLAEKVDVSSHYIYEIEKGLKTMSLPLLMELSNELGISTDYLLFGSEATRPDPDKEKDNLEFIIEKIPKEKRNTIANILEVIVPNLK